MTRFDVEHDKRLHLIAVRRDFSGFQHVHPQMALDGTWTTTLDLSAGQWRLFADFKATGRAGPHLGQRPCRTRRIPTRRPAGRLSDLDGRRLPAATLDGHLAAGKAAKLTLTVTRDGKPVTDLEPYLGAYGHLVALRAGDLAYLHVHPEGTPGDGVTKPGPG